MRELVEDIMYFNGTYKRRNYVPKKAAEEEVKLEQPKIPEPELMPVPIPKVLEVHKP